jgi:hypothetical protein
MDIPGSPHNQLTLPQSAFKNEAAEDPYLSGPSELEDFSLENHPTPGGSLHQDPSSRFSPVSSPSVEQISNHPMQSYDYGENSFDPPNLFDFDLSGSSDPGILSSVTTSPGPDDLLLRNNGGTGQLSSDFGIVDYQMPPKNTRKRQASLESCGQAPVGSGFVTAFPLSVGQNPDFMAIDNPQLTRLNIPDPAHDMDNLSLSRTPTSMPSQSPLVKVSTYTRGDSPTRDESERDRRRSSRSSIHLSPSQENNDHSEMYDDNTGLGLVDHGSTNTRAEDGSWIPNPATGHAGLDPSARGDEFVPSPKEVEEERYRAERNVDIEIWSASVSVANSDAGDEYLVPNQNTRQRPRSVSAIETRQDYFSIMQRDDYNIPGPGQLIHESDPGSDFETASHDGSAGSSDDGLPSLEYCIENDPIARQLILHFPWKDHAHLALPVFTKSQPNSSRDAMQLYEDLSKEFETASRVATWGTRRLASSEVDSLLESDGFLKNLSISKSSLLKLLPRRSNSASKHKRHLSQTGSQRSSFEGEQLHQDHESKRESITGSMMSRRSSLNRPKSPNGVLAAAMFASQMATSIGGHSSISAAPTTTHKGGLSPATLINRFRNRSKSEGARAAPDLQELNLEKPRPPIVPTPSHQLQTPAAPGIDDGDDDDDDSIDDKGVLMNLAPSLQQIVPTQDGFRRQISSLNPRLAQPLVDRFANEQIRRFTKLIEDKNKHATAVKRGKCAARHRCFASGGEAHILPPKTNAKDPSATHCQFQISGPEASDDESKGLMDGTIAPAIFPLGVPIPPVKKLPAEFECTLCFKAKKIYKPSDWTKHVHEDIQPFTCTFPNCGEPKSFKRKADWVRHENERHRHLEWWACNMPECDHTCYRKDNFVQHLVREHKRPEPKSKKTKSAASGGTEEQEVASLWKQVDECHKETDKSPTEEPCRFCGNVCDDWKKLTVHLAKHMEQIALPILQLVEKHSSTTNNRVNPTKKATSISPISPAPSAGILNYSSDGVAKTEPSMNGTMMARQVSYGGSQPGEQPHLHPTQSPLLLSPTMGQSDVPSGTTYPPPSHYTVSSSSYLDPHYTPVYRNTRSYPPANPMPARQQTSFVPMTEANPFETISTDGITEPPQQLYHSPTAENMYVSQDGMFPTMYENTPAIGYQISTSPEGDHLSAHGYMPQNHSPTYPFQ